MTLTGNPISLGQAAKKYLVPVQTLSRWAEKGELTILKRPERRGESMLVDEGSVIIAREQHRKAWDRGGVVVTSPAGAAAAAQAPPPPPEYKTAELVQAYHTYGEMRGFAPSTMVKHRHHLGLFAAACPTLPLTPEPIIDFIHGLKVASRTKKTYYECIRQFYNYLEEFKKIPTPLSPKMVPKTDRHPYFRVLSREEIIKLFNSAESYQERMILTTLYSTAVRVGELVSLTSDNLFPDHIVVTGKTGTREVPISQDLYDQLRLLGEGPIFRDRRGKPISRDGIGQRVAKCMKAVGITGRKLGPHTLRHTSLTHLYEDTGDLPLVQTLAGHTELETTMIYTHPTDEAQRTKLREFDRLKMLGPRRSPPAGKADDKALESVIADNGEDE
jgi:site-specific recombinase XerD